jgi:uncharacterized protein YecT (DUF1311 family)
MNIAPRGAAACLALGLAFSAGHSWAQGHGNAEPASTRYEDFQLSGRQEAERHGPDLEPCVARGGGSDAAVAVCLSADRAVQNVRLGRAYAEAMARLPDDAARRRLTAEQSNWLTTRNRICDRTLARGRRSTQDRLTRSHCTLDEVIRRTVWLEAYR